MSYFENFLSQVGVKDADQLLAQISSQVNSEQFKSLVDDLKFYENLAQVAQEHQQESKSVGGILAQTGIISNDKEEGLEEVT